MTEGGVVDASGRAKDGTYWRSKSIFGAVVASEFVALLPLTTSY